MFDFDMFPDIGEGLFPLPESGNCPFCEDNGNGGESGNVNPESEMSLAMGYVPAEGFDGLYEDYSEALTNGSLFRPLVKPFYGGKGER